MPYAVHGDVAAEFKGLSSTGFTTTTTPKAAEVTEWILRASYLIDSKIAGKYSVPVDSTASPAAYSILKEICINLVRHKLSGILNLPTGDSKTSSGAAKDTEKKAMDALADIQSGKMKLVDAPLATAPDGVQGQGANDRATLQPPTFRKTGDQW